MVRTRSQIPINKYQLQRFRANKMLEQRDIDSLDHSFTSHITVLKQEGEGERVHEGAAVPGRARSALAASGDDGSAGGLVGSCSSAVRIVGEAEAATFAPREPWCEWCGCKGGTPATPTEPAIAGVQRRLPVPVPAVLPAPVFVCVPVPSLAPCDGRRVCGCRGGGAMI